MIHVFYINASVYFLIVEVAETELMSKSSPETIKLLKALVRHLPVPGGQGVGDEDFAKDQLNTRLVPLLPPRLRRP